MKFHVSMQPEDNWEQFANCHGWPVVFEKKGKRIVFDPFFEAFEDFPEIRPSVKQMCFSCPVREICELEGRRGRTGVWGGKFLEDGEVVEEYE